MSKRRLWVRRVLISLLILFVVWIGWGFAILFIYGDAGVPFDSYTGSKSLEDRESLEDYVETTVPSIEQFINGYSEATGAEIKQNPIDGNVDTCLDKVGQTIEYSKGGTARPSLELLLALGQTYLVPNGYKLTEYYPDNENPDLYFSLRWRDLSNGGYVFVTMYEYQSGKYVIDFDSYSSCRPTDGTTDAELGAQWGERRNAEQSQSADQQSS